MKLKPQTAIFITLSIFILGIFTANAYGLWSVEESKVPEKLTEAEFLGEYDPEGIRGSFTFSEISSYYRLPVEELAAAFGVDSAAAADFKCKDLETIYEGSDSEIGTGSVKLFVACYLGLPYEPAEDTWLPKSAADVLAGSGAMTDEEREYLSSHTIFVQ